MNHTVSSTLVVVVLAAFSRADASRTTASRFSSRGGTIYFTSWKYVRQGQFAWRTSVIRRRVTGAERRCVAQGGWQRPARLNRATCRAASGWSRSRPGRNHSKSGQWPPAVRWRQVQDVVHRRAVAESRTVQQKDKILPGHAAAWPTRNPPMASTGLNRSWA